MSNTATPLKLPVTELKLDHSGGRIKVESIQFSYEAELVSAEDLGEFVAELTDKLNGKEIKWDVSFSDPGRIRDFSLDNERDIFARHTVENDESKSDE